MPSCIHLCVGPFVLVCVCLCNLCPNSPPSLFMSVLVSEYTTGPLLLSICGWAVGLWLCAKDLWSPNRLLLCLATTGQQSGATCAGEWSAGEGLWALLWQEDRQQWHRRDHSHTGESHRGCVHHATVGACQLGVLTLWHCRHVMCQLGALVSWHCCHVANGVLMSWHCHHVTLAGCINVMMLPSCDVSAGCTDGMTQLLCDMSAGWTEVMTLPSCDASAGCPDVMTPLLWAVSAGCTDVMTPPSRDLSAGCTDVMTLPSCDMSDGCSDIMTQLPCNVSAGELLSWCHEVCHILPSTLFTHYYAILPEVSILYTFVTMMTWGLMSLGVVLMCVFHSPQSWIFPSSSADQSD